MRDALRRPWLTGLLVVSVALGVAVVVAIDMANESASRAFALSTEAVVGKATHQIRGGPNGLDETVYRDLRVIDGYRASAPVVEGYGIAVELGRQTVHVIGVDPFAEAPFRTYFNSTTSAPLDALTGFFTQPGAVLMSADSAARFGVKVGDALTLDVGSQRRQAVVVGFLQSPNEVSGRALEGLWLTDIATAQEFFAMAGRLSRIDLIATASAAEAIAARLPPNLTLAPASEQSNTVAQITAAFQLNLTAFSLLALLVGTFLIYNTVTFSVVQRRQVFGIMRSLGVTGAQIFGLVLMESALLGALGAALGLGLGVLLGRTTVQLVTQTINDLYFNVTVNSIDVTWLTVIKGIALGIGAALLAAVAPAAEATTAPAVATLQRSSLEERVRQLVPRLALAGVLLVAGGAALIAFIQTSVVASFAGLFIGLIGVVLWVPAITVGLMRLAAVGLGRAGLTGRMAARTVTGALSRTAVAIAALMVAVSVTIGVTVMIASFRTTVGHWLDQTLLADIYISPPQATANRSVTMEPALAERIRAVPGVAEVEVYRNVVVDAPALGAVRVSAVTVAHARDAGLYRYAAGTPGETWQAVEGGAVVVTEPFANHHHLPPSGGAVTLLTDQGPHTFPVAAISYDYSSDQGIVLMSLNVYRRYWNDPEISSVAAFVSAGANREMVEDAVRAALAGSVVVVRGNKALRDAALVVFDRTFAITAALRWVAVIVAFIGVVSATMALQLERTRELGVLSAAGMTLAQLWRLTLLETGLMGATAGLLSMPTGLALAAVLIYVINLRSFGWTIFFAPAPEVYLEALALSVAAALLAAVYPMRRLMHASRETTAALRSE